MSILTRRLVLPLLVLLLSVWTLHTRICRAEAQLSAVLIQPEHPDDTVREITARLRGELTAAGFDVTQRALPEPITPRLLIERSDEYRGKSAVILVRPAADSSDVELWISDQVLGRTSNSRLSVLAGERDGTRRAAVEAAELLRARIAELRMGALAEPPPAAPTPVAPAPEAVQSVQKTAPRVALSAGVSFLFRPHLWELATMPRIGVELTMPPPPADHTQAVWGVALRSAGYGHGIARSEGAGNVRVRQGLALVNAFVRAQSRQIIQPELSLGVGVYGIGVRGRASPPYEPHRLTNFCPLLAGGFALQTQLVAWLTLRVSADLMYATEKSAVRIADRQVARTGGMLGAVNLELSVFVW